MEFIVYSPLSFGSPGQARLRMSAGIYEGSIRKRNYPVCLSGQQLYKERKMP